MRLASNAPSSRCWLVVHDVLTTVTGLRPSCSLSQDTRKGAPLRLRVVAYAVVPCHCETDMHRHMAFVADNLATAPPHHQHPHYHHHRYSSASRPEPNALGGSLSRKTRRIWHPILFSPASTHPLRQPRSRQAQARGKNKEKEKGNLINPPRALASSVLFLAAPCTSK